MKTMLPLYLLAAVLQVPAQAQSARIEHLRDVRTIYVASFGDAPGANVIKEKVVNQLVRSGKLRVTESPDSADAALIGLGQIMQGFSASSYGSLSEAGTTEQAVVVVRLVSKDKVILWTDESSRATSSKAAEKMVKNLLRAMEKDGKQKR